MTDVIGDYIASLAEDAKKLRDAHGGRNRWWIGHDPSKCEACGNKPVSVRLSPYRRFERRPRNYRKKMEAVA